MKEYILINDSKFGYNEFKNQIYGSITRYVEASIHNNVYFNTSHAMGQFYFELVFQIDHSGIFKKLNENYR